MASTSTIPPTSSDSLLPSSTPVSPPPPLTPPKDVQLNPWDEAPILELPNTTAAPPPVLPEASDAFGSNLPSTPVVKAVINPDVLDEFDPLVDKVERSSRDAWATSESHPPPPPPPKSPPPPQSAPPSSSAFPFLASTIARTFSRSRAPTPIPTTPNAKPDPRRRSEGDAAPVPSSSTAQNFPSEVHEEMVNEKTNEKTSGTDDEPSQTSQFDFQKFLDQMKTRSAEPAAKYLRSFLSNFSKKQFTVNDQIRLIHDFLTFIAARMRECDIWRNASDADFDNAQEAMEKLVMNRLYEFTFTPQMARSNHPVTTDDLEKDQILTQRIRLFRWIREEHLDIPVGEGSRGFVNFAESELLKINHYKAPRDKLICILNCCKVIYGLIRHVQKEEGADAFIPILIFVVLKANPEHLLSNVEYINRFRNASKLQSEAGYYLSSLMGAVSFIETMDHTSLSNITQEEFEKNVEEAILTLPPSPSGSSDHSPNPSISAPHAGEEPANPLHFQTPTLSEDTRRFIQRTGDLAQQTISKPLNAIGRIFADAMDGDGDKGNLFGGVFPIRKDEVEALRRGEKRMSLDQKQIMRTPASSGAPSAPLQTPYKPRVRRPSPSGSVSSTPGRLTPDPTTPSRLPSYEYISSLPPLSYQPSLLAPSSSPSRTGTPLDFTALQNEIDRAHGAAANAAKETLKQIFPTVDDEVVDMVLEAKDGDLGACIDMLLEMSVGN